MNTRSLVFRLTAWYAGLLSVVFTLIGVVTFVGLEHYLESTLESTLQRRSEQAVRMVIAAGETTETKLISQIQDGLLPESSNRFVRITRPNGSILYRSGMPADHSFDPNLIAPIDMDHVAKGSRREVLSGGKMLLIVTTLTPTGSGIYSIEVGSSLEEIQSVEDHLLRLMLQILPVLITIAVGGGFILVSKALVPVDNISRGAERITHHNLSERLTVAPTGDALERLSISVNHMIARLDEAFQNSRRFLADASHELRTPLTVLKGELEELATNQELASEEGRVRLAVVLEEVQRLRVIVEGLFALSRLDAGDAQREWIVFDLAELVQSTTEQMKLLAEDQDIDVICKISQKVYVEGDRGRLKQVVVNLIDNAIKYTPKGGNICLNVSVQNEQATLEVIDSGIGIPTRALPQVFDRFFRVDKARSRDQGGAGLGLSIVKSICAAHGGSIKVESALGIGSHFTVTLPLADSEVSGELLTTLASAREEKRRTGSTKEVFVDTNAQG